MSRLQLADLATRAVLMGALVALVQPVLVPGHAFETPSLGAALGLGLGVAAGSALARRFGQARPE